MLLQRKPEVNIENYNFNWRSLTDVERCWIMMWSSPLPPINQLNLLFLKEKFKLLPPLLPPLERGC